MPVKPVDADVAAADVAAPKSDRAAQPKSRLQAARAARAQTQATQRARATHTQRTAAALETERRQISYNAAPSPNPLATQERPRAATSVGGRVVSPNVAEIGTRVDAGPVIPGPRTDRADPSPAQVGAVLPKMMGDVGTITRHRVARPDNSSALMQGPTTQAPPPTTSTTRPSSPSLALRGGGSTAARAANTVVQFAFERTAEIFNIPPAMRIGLADLVGARFQKLNFDLSITLQKEILANKMDSRLSRNQKEQLEILTKEVGVRLEQCRQERETMQVITNLAAQIAMMMAATVGAGASKAMAGQTPGGAAGGAAKPPAAGAAKAGAGGPAKSATPDISVSKTKEVKPHEKTTMEKIRGNLKDMFEDGDAGFTARSQESEAAGSAGGLPHYNRYLQAIQQMMGWLHQYAQESGQKQLRP